MPRGIRKPLPKDIPQQNTPNKGKVLNMFDFRVPTACAEIFQCLNQDDSQHVADYDQREQIELTVSDDDTDARGLFSPAVPDTDCMHAHILAHTNFAPDDPFKFDDYECMETCSSDSDAELIRNRRIGNTLNPCVCPSKQGGRSVKAGLQMSMPCPRHNTDSCPAHNH